MRDEEDKGENADTMPLSHYANTPRFPYSALALLPSCPLALFPFSHTRYSPHIPIISPRVPSECTAVLGIGLEVVGGDDLLALENTIGAHARRTVRIGIAGRCARARRSVVDVLVGRASRRDAVALFGDVTVIGDGTTDDGRVVADLAPGAARRIAVAALRRRDKRTVGTAARVVGAAAGAAAVALLGRLPDAVAADARVEDGPAAGVAETRALDRRALADDRLRARGELVERAVVRRVHDVLALAVATAREVAALAAGAARRAGAVGRQAVVHRTNVVADLVRNDAPLLRHARSRHGGPRHRVRTLRKRTRRAQHVQPRNTDRRARPNQKKMSKNQTKMMTNQRFKKY